MERGGTTTQSGIIYQNTITALYLGRLIDTKSRQKNQTVVKVRAEAPEEVDDIVVTFADGHKEYYQVKESLELGAPWNKMWKDFWKQINHSDFNYNDKVVIATPTSPLIEQVLELSRRASTSKDVGEWNQRLTQQLKTTLNKIREIFNPTLDNKDTFLLLKEVNFELFGTLEYIERDVIQYWMPESNNSKENLFSILRDKVGGHARIRGEFTSPILLEVLNRDHDIRILDQWDNVTAYQNALTAFCNKIEIPGTSLSGPLNELYIWPRFVQNNENPNPFLLVNSDELESFQGETEITLKDFPRPPIKKGVIVAGAGLGKSSLFKALTSQMLSSKTWVPALISLPEFTASGLGIVEFLYKKTKEDFNCTVDWNYYLENGRAVLLFDGLDEIDKNRVNVLQKITLLSGRYPEISWLVAVRDVKAVSVPLGVPFIRICDLDYEKATQIVMSYRKYGGVISHDIFLNKWFNDSEFSRLASVPFFLALIITTSRSETDLTKGRTNILKNYINMALHPEFFRTNISLSYPADTLISAAELLAFNSLDNFALEEIHVNSILRTAYPHFDPTLILKDLSICGLINSPTQYISFTFPSIAEFLAARYLCKLGPSSVLQNINRLKYRPWAQTVQYALEEFSDPTDLMSSLLNEEDDAYMSILRMVARSVSHGAKPSKELYKLIGDKLADSWLTMPTHTLKNEIGILLSEGYSKEIPYKVSRLLQKGIGLQVGGGKILSLANNPSLTLSALESYLSEDIYLRSNLHEFQPAVNEIAITAMEKYIGRIELSRDEEISTLSSLILALDPKRLDKRRIDELCRQTNLPILIRLALMNLNNETLDKEILPLVLEVLNRPPKKESRLPEGAFLATKVLIDTNNIVENIIEVLNTIDEPETLNHIIFQLLDDENFLPKTALVKILEKVHQELHLPTESINFIKIISSTILDDKTELMNIIKEINELTKNECVFLVGWITALESTELVKELLGSLETASSKVKENVSTNLAFGMKYQIRFIGFQTWVSKKKRHHNAAYDVALKFYEWSNLYNGTSKLDFLSYATDLGHEEAGKMLQKELSNSDDFFDIEEDNTFNSWLSSLKYQGLNIAIQRLKVIVLRKGCNNDARSSVNMIANYGNSEAISLLLDLRKENLDPYIHEAIEGEIQQLAGKLGHIIRRDSDGLPFIEN